MGAAILRIIQKSRLKWAILALAVTLESHPGSTRTPAQSELPAGPAPFASLGAKVGEVRPTSVLIQSYLFAQPAEALLPQPYAERTYRGRPGRVRVEYRSSQLRHLFSGPVSQGEFDHYLEQERESKFTSWVEVPQNGPLVSNSHNPTQVTLLQEAQGDDFSFHLSLESLRPSTRYEYRLWIQGSEGGSVRPSRTFQFTTAPNPADLQDVSFLATTCFNHARMRDLKEDVWPVRGFRMYRGILDRVGKGELKFDFAVFNGDTVYLDKQNPDYRRGVAQRREDMRARFFDTYLTPLSREFFGQFPAYFLKDDHDWRFNDADPVLNSQRISGTGLFQVRKYYRGPPGPFLGKKIFEEMNPVGQGPSRPPYRTFRWGRGLQIWLLEARECRYPNARQLKRYGIKGLVPPAESHSDGMLYYPDYCGTPSEEQAWGEKQFSWLIETLKASDAYFKIIVSPTPVLGPDQKVYWRVGWNPLRRKQDNHVTRFRQEFTRFLRAVREEGLENLYFVSGDRHFLWHSRYQARDGQFSLDEFGPGPFADDIVPFGKLFYEDEEGAANLQAGLLSAGFLHVRVENVAVQPRLRVEWYAMQDWETASVARWSYSFEAPYLP